MNTALVGGRYWSIVDVVLIVALGSLTIVGTINYPLRILPWTYIGIMTFGPFWISIRTTPAIRRAASPIMRELFATTHKPAEWFVNLIVGAPCGAGCGGGVRGAGVGQCRCWLRERAAFRHQQMAYLDGVRVAGQREGRKWPL